jgi:hypothetical protein
MTATTTSKTFAEREAAINDAHEAAFEEATKARVRGNHARNAAKAATAELKRLPAVALAALDAHAAEAAETFYALIVDGDWLRQLVQNSGVTPAIDPDALAAHVLAHSRDGVSLEQRIADAINRVPSDPGRSALTDRTEQELRADIDAANKRAEAADKATATAEAKVRAANAALRAL